MTDPNAEYPMLPTPIPYPGPIVDQKQVNPGNVGIPTQVANPARTTVRTVVQAIIGILIVAVPLANIVLSNLIDYLSKQTDLQVDPIVFVWLNLGLAVTAFVIGLVSRIMATPGVAEFIQKYIPWLAPIKSVAGGEHEA